MLILIRMISIYSDPDHLYIVCKHLDKLQQAMFMTVFNYWITVLGKKNNGRVRIHQFNSGSVRIRIYKTGERTENTVKKVKSEGMNESAHLL